MGDFMVNAYDEVGNLTSFSDELSHTTRYAYDGLNRPISETNALTHTILYGYDELGNKRGMTQTISGVQVTEVYTYDAASRLVASRDGEGNVRAYGYDAASRLDSVADPETGLSTTTVYDNADRPSSLTDALGHVTAFSYTEADYTRVMTDAELNPTVYDYDPLGRLLSVTDSEDQVTRYEYDLAGNRTKLIDANQHEREYSFDGLNRRTAITLRQSPTATHSTLYGYDAVGAVVTRTDASSRVTQFHYDPLGRLDAIDYPGADPDVAYAYDAVGNRRSMSDGSGVTSYSYDWLERPVQVVYTATASTPITVAYGYDEAGHRTQLTYPDSDAVDYGYDRAGRLTTVEDWSDRLTTYDYDAAGRVLTTTLPNGVISAYGYDDAGRLVTITHSITSTVLAEFAHSLDDVGNRIGRSGPYDGNTETYTLDDVYRLTRVVYPDDDESTYEYDAVGNRDSMVEIAGGNTVTTTYRYGSLDELTQIVVDGVPTVFDWDDTGNQIAKGSFDYAYDAENRLVRSDTDGVSSAFTYNGDGVRTRKVLTATGTVTVDYSLDTINELPAVLADGSQKYVYGLDLIAEVDGSDDPLYYLADGVGSTVALADGDGIGQQAYSYDVFGAVRGQVGGEPNDFTFTGEQVDIDSDLIFLRARYYDPATGRFLGRDPLEGREDLPASLNPYTYGHDNPVLMTDPSGQQWTEVGEWRRIIWTLTPPCVANTAACAFIAAGAAPFAVAGSVTLLPDPGDLGTVAGGLVPLIPPMPASISVLDGIQLGEVRGGVVTWFPECPPMPGVLNVLRPSESPYWTDKTKWTRYRQGVKTNGLSGRERRYAEWDYGEGHIEIYNRNGDHVGAFDAIDGHEVKPREPGRNIRDKLR
jgi:RHS repeat-associated protein